MLLKKQHMKLFYFLMLASFLCFDLQAYELESFKSEQVEAKATRKKRHHFKHRCHKKPSLKKGGGVLGVNFSPGIP